MVFSDIDYSFVSLAVTHVTTEKLHLTEKVVI